MSVILAECPYEGEAGGLLFGNGMILAIFHPFGSLPSRSEQLKIAVSGGASRAAWSFKTQAGVLSGPDALFVLILRRALRWFVYL